MTEQTCPSCGSPSLLSVRGIVEQGTTVTTVTSDGGAVALDGDGGVMPALTRMTSTVATSSMLAQRLAPPEPPARRQSPWGRVQSYLLSLTGIPMMFAIPIWVLVEPTAGWVAALVGIPCWLGLYVGTSIPIGRIRRRLKSRHDWEVKQWEKLVARWERLRYCSACDSVVDLARKRAVSGDEMAKLLRAA